MEEEIKVLEEFVKENRNWHCIECGYNCEKDMKTEQAIENLINKNKELEKERDEIYADYQDLGKEKLELEEKCEEQEKIIELMNEYILKEYISPEICSKHTPEDCYADIYDDEACKKCILDYFRKKAKGG